MAKVSDLWVVLVVWKTGEQEYMKQGMGSHTAVFPSKESAQRQADFLKMGIEGDCQSISIVRVNGRAQRMALTPQTPIPDPAAHAGRDVSEHAEKEKTS